MSEPYIAYAPENISMALTEQDGMKAIILRMTGNVGIDTYTMVDAKRLSDRLEALVNGTRPDQALLFGEHIWMIGEADPRLIAITTERCRTLVDDLRRSIQLESDSSNVIELKTVG
ncbi:hypothetical protein [Aestuariivirga litoralis]|uniref:hypothetical protein n=1 Tax=Aestuariivirga litoralis TaxID=2650924 RepID=UPI0018C4C7C9|nr:hypothetical protein [Aestuariivirga litoralis]MBG1231081.1 hypothetical protein [Aestuariivirga litoralis]